MTETQSTLFDYETDHDGTLPQARAGISRIAKTAYRQFRRKRKHRHLGDQL